MPSGAKRRKAAAAKKKKEQESPTLTPSGSRATSFNGGDDLKGKENEGGQVSSPASQDPIKSGGHSFSEEGVDKDTSPVRQIDSEKVNEEEEAGIVKVDVDVDEEEGRVEITREMKLDEVSGGGGNLSVEVGINSDGSSSSSCSSDDEEVHIEKNPAVLDSLEVVEVCEVVENSEDSQVPAVVLEELMETADYNPALAFVSEEVVEAANDSQAPAVVFEMVLETADVSPVPAIVLDEVVEAADESQVPDVVLEELVYIPETALVEKIYEDLGKPVLSELNDELKATEDAALPMTLPTVVSHGETSNVDPFNVKNAKDYVLQPSDSPIAVTRNGVGHHPKYPEIQDSFDNQTPLLQAPLSVQRTSWKGCCGLFEVFTRSR